VALLTRRRLAIIALLAAGCPVGVAVRPDGSPAEEPCPAGAREAMDALGLVPAANGRPGSSAQMDLDVTQRREGVLIVYDGPLESETVFPIEELPAKTRLFGRAWTGGPRVVIRYYSAQFPDGRRIPFCAVAGWNGPGLPKAPGRPGSAALSQTFASVYVVSQFR
jgi:hypothetical protein